MPLEENVHSRSMPFLNCPSLLTDECNVEVCNSFRPVLSLMKVSRNRMPAMAYSPILRLDITASS